jgi:hypothetical protein
LRIFGAVNAACLFTSTGWTQAAHGLAAALCGMQVVTSLIDATVSDDKVSHSEVGGNPNGGT